jgi:hypothetical protein
MFKLLFGFFTHFILGKIRHLIYPSKNLIFAGLETFDLTNHLDVEFYAEFDIGTPS